MRLVDDLRHRVVMVDHGNGDVTDEPDDVCQQAAATIEQLFTALKNFTEFMRYGMDKPKGATPNRADLERVEALAVEAADALHAADPDYLLHRPNN